MRAVVWCAIVSLTLLAMLVGRRADGALPKLDREPSCEEQCRLVGERDAAACDERGMHEGERALCHESVRARLDICLRLCED